MDMDKSVGIDVGVEGDGWRRARRRKEVNYNRITIKNDNLFNIMKILHLSVR